MSAVATIVRDFAKPVTIAGVTYTRFEMREASVDDMFTAELELANRGGGVHTPLAFNGEMMVLQLQGVHSDSSQFAGPFTIGMLKGWGKANYRSLRAAQMELDEQGEA